jgi:hypothetical protein
MDKNSLWDELNLQEKELYFKRKKSQDMGRLLKTYCEDLDQEISEWDEGNPRQDLNPHPSTKRVFYPLLRTDLSLAPSI